MIRTIQSEEITRNIKEMCIEANHVLSDDMKKVFCDAVGKERSPLGRQILSQLEENLKIAGGRHDSHLPGYRYGGHFPENRTGYVHIEGGSLADAVNQGST